MRRYLFRHMQPVTFKATVLAVLGATIVISAVLLLGDVFSRPMMVASFGATAVLLFATPNSPVSQPANVIAGHVVAATIGLTLASLWPGNHLLAGLSVGLSIGVMMWFRIVNPPAGATGLVAYLDNPGWMFLIFPVFAGTVVLIALTTVMHRLRGIEYPLEPK